MKNVFALIGLLIASSVSFVHTADTSWDVLMQDKTLKIDAPVVFMGHAVDYTFVCVDGNMLRTKKAVAQRETIFIGKNREVCKDKVVSGTYPTTVNVKEIWAQDFSEEFVELFAGLQEISEIAETNLELKISSRAVRQMSSQLANSEAYGLYFKTLPAYSELYADTLAVLFFNDPSVMYKALHYPQIPPNKEVFVSPRDFAKEHSASDLHAHPDDHTKLSLVRSFIGKHMNTDLEQKRLLLKRLEKAITLSIREDLESGNSPTLEEANARLLRHLLN